MGRFLVVAGLVAALVAACVATGDLEFIAGTPGPPETVRDVEGIVQAAHRRRANETARAVNELLHLAAVRGGKGGSRLLREELPPLAAQLAGELPPVLDEIRAVEATTPVGNACQQAVIRLLERDVWLFRQLASEPAGGRPTAKMIERFVASYEANARGYEADVKKCLALASADERPAVADLMAAL
jgi:hypothetical protein